MAQGNELPYDVLSEVGVVGSLLMNPDYILRTDYLKPKMFYNKENACIYGVIQTLYNKGITEIDDFTILSQIEGNNYMKNVFSNLDIPSIQTYLEEIRLVARSNFDEYVILANRVISLSFKREAFNTLNTLSKECLKNDDKNANVLNMEIQDIVSNLAEKYIFDDSIQLLGEKIDEVWDDIVGRRQEGGFSGLPSKYNSINKYFTYEDGELYILGGRAKGGKSMFMMNEAYHKLKEGVPVAIFDTEMSTRRWLERFLALITGIKVVDIRNGNYNKEQEEILFKAREWIKKQPMVHMYDSSWTKDKIYTKAKILKLKMKLGFLIFDYIKVDNSNNINVQEHNFLGDMANFLKNKVAGALDIPVLSGGQMSPKEQRLADSDKLNRYASVIAYWMQKTQEEILNDTVDEGNYKFFIDYNRLGSQMLEGEYLNFVFYGDYANIKQAKIPEHGEGSTPF